MDDIKVITLEKMLIEKNIDRFIEIGRQIYPSEYQYWGKTHYLKDLSYKCLLSKGAFINDDVIGFIIATKKNDGKAHIHKYVVEKTFRSMGIGIKMLQSLINTCLENDISNITLSINADNLRGIKFHQRNGFVDSYRKETDYGLYIVMELILPDVL